MFDKRIVLKTLSWRVVATSSTILLSWIITRSIQIAFSIAIIDMVIKTIIYYLHELGWKKCSL